MRARGLNPAFVHAYIDMLHAKDEGTDNRPPRASAIIGPTRFRPWEEGELKVAVNG